MPTFKKNTSPAMKRSGFKMKSGNTPLFKYMASSPSPITSPANMGTSPYKQSYEIQKGDSLSKIARANNTTVEAIMAANPSIKDKNKIYPKTTINLSSSTETDTNDDVYLYEETKDGVTSGGFGVLKPDQSKKMMGKAETTAKAARKAKLGAAGRNLAEIFMGGIHNVYGNPDKSSKTTEFDEEKAYKRWAKEKSDKETMTLAQQIIADDKKKSQIKKA